MCTHRVSPHLVQVEPVAPRAPLVRRGNAVQEGAVVPEHAVEQQHNLRGLG